MRWPDDGADHSVPSPLQMGLPGLRTGLLVPETILDVLAAFANQRDNCFLDRVSDMHLCEGVEDGIRELLDAPLDDGFREERLLRQPLEISRRYSVGRILTPDFHGHVSAEFGIVDRAHEVVEWREPDLLVFRAGFMVESEKFLPCASLLPIR
jgi:hypothetical protein